MKYIVLVGDGMADRPLKRLGYKTCLQKAHTPNMDEIAAKGEVGRLKTIPKGFAPGSDIANLSILGYNPVRYYSGRAPIEAAYRGIRLGPMDVAFRCNLVTLKFVNSKHREAALMQDYSAGHISTQEATSLIEEINNKLGNDKIKFYPGVSYRHLMIWKNGKDKIQCTPPHDITGRKIANYLPKGDGQEVLRDLMEKSTEILLSHPVNKKRVERGLAPANSLWFWGQGKRLLMPEFKDKYNLDGVIISAVDLIKGLGISVGFKVVHVKGATGYLDTNYVGKARAALRALEKVDFVYLHVEAPDEAGHNGDIKAKIKAIEDFDSKVVGTILRGIKKFKEYSILLLPDHSTPISVKTHTDDPVPFAIYRSNKPKDLKTRIKSFSEDICKTRGIRIFEKGYKLMDYFIKGR
jgi:2,3-bisphosphoglycerate-independent phosphoglycerate mutase